MTPEGVQAYEDAEPPLWTNLGSLAYPVTTASPEAQSYFDQGLRMAANFNHAEARRAFRKAQKLDPRTFNSVANKTALAAKTNRQIGGNAPSRYLPVVEKAAGVGPARMDEILASHCIDAAHLRADRFWEFFGARAEALLSRIEAATGKSIARAPELFGAGAAMDAFEDGEEWDGEEAAEEPAA